MAQNKENGVEQVEATPLLKYLLILMVVVLATRLVLADQTVYGNLYVQYNTSTHGYFKGDGRYLTNLDVSSIEDIWVNESGDTMSGDLNMDGNELTSVGELVMSGVITSRNIIPDTTELYTLGNSTNWWDIAYIKQIYAKSISTISLNATDITSDNIASDTLDLENNMTLGDIIIKEQDSNYVVILT